MTEAHKPRTQQRDDRDDEVQRDHHPHSCVHCTRFHPVSRRLARSTTAAVTAFFAFCFLGQPIFAQTLSNGPTSGSTTLLPSRDYATYAWNDAWDMDKRTDIGWMTWGVDLPGNQMVSKQMTGCSSGVTG